MNHQLLCLCAIWTWAILGCGNPQYITLASEKKARFEISLPEHPHEWEVKAANELQIYFKASCGIELPISRESKASANIWIESNSDLPKDQSIFYGLRKGNLHIQGGSPKATLYAVYTFLEQEMGCRFYGPDAEIIPRQKYLKVDAELDYQYTPPIRTRTVHSRLFYDNHDYADKLKVTHESFPYYVPKARVHTFHRFLPAAQFYKDHPEYYALRNGKRLTTQLCLTNEQVFHIVMDSVASWLKQYPESAVISVSQDDNTQYCQCESCEAIHQREGSPAGSMIHFVNRIAKEFPDKTISTLAYQYTRKAPKELKPEPNVLITLCSIECDRSAPINEKCQDFTRDLIAWGKLTDNVRIWDYTTQFTNFLAPFPNLHTLQPNLQLFEANHAIWVFEQHSREPSELFELRSYLTAKLLWNPSVDVDSITIDFLQGYYGNAAPFIHSYISTVHEEMQRDSSFFLFLYGDPSQGFNSFLRLELLKQYDSWYEQATEAVKDQPELKKRVSLARLSIDYAILEYAKREMASAIQDPFFDLPARILRFKKSTQSGNIHAMNEMRYTVAAYLELYEKTLARANKPNKALHKPVQLLSKPKKYAREDPQTLTDGAYGGTSFYANWLGFEGNDLEAVIDLENPQSISEVSAAFLQLTNHIVFFPEEVQYLGSLDNQRFVLLGRVKNNAPLNKNSKINDIQYFTQSISAQTFRYIKIIGKNMKIAPDWHHAASLPAWIFMDELEVR